MTVYLTEAEWTQHPLKHLDTQGVNIIPLCCKGKGENVCVKVTNSTEYSVCYKSNLELLRGLAHLKLKG